ncbi:Na/Pi cotransporter family protein [Paenibacillus senegalensis]|uniref:Na/Pi cotransporter family protein n=1 Tax=Paenibacillus senegalensis TaxID=1465766 RepID=UPI0002880A00|nr:Na/Pi symporter [Paenibacillus senegalensis]
MEKALHQWAGNHLQTTLERFTRTPFRGMVASAAITAAVQSSTAITVITIGLVNAGLMKFSQTLGVILGTNIGTTLTTELLSLNLTKHALPLFIIAMSVWLTSLAIPAATRSLNPPWLHHIRNLALALIGFSCVLLGMEVMQSIIPELRSRGLFAWFVQQSQSSLLWGLLAGIIISGLVHSGVLTITLAMSMASVQAITVEVGIAIAIGSNIGTCVTALMASIGGSRFGVYVAWTHILLNVGGALAFYPLISLLTSIVAAMSDSPAIQIAHAQTIFNIVCSLAALPLCYTPLIKKIK